MDCHQQKIILNSYNSLNSWLCKNISVVSVLSVWHDWSVRHDRSAGDTVLIHHTLIAFKWLITILSGHHKVRKIRGENDNQRSNIVGTKKHIINIFYKQNHRVLDLWKDSFLRQWPWSSFRSSLAPRWKESRYVFSSTIMSAGIRARGSKMVKWSNFRSSTTYSDSPCWAGGQGGNGWCWPWRCWTNWSMTIVTSIPRIRLWWRRGSRRHCGR